MNNKLLNVSIAARRLSVHPSTVRRMFHGGQLQGIMTGPSKTRIRVFERSVDSHISEQTKHNERDGME
jgi:excisionase family DNA binding protein